jgi:hypothetical protein
MGRRGFYFAIPGAVAAALALAASAAPYLPRSELR